MSAKNPVTPYEHIIFEIVAWEPSNTFSVAEPKGWRPSSNDHLSIEAEGKCLLRRSSPA